MVLNSVFKDEEIEYMKDKFRERKIGLQSLKIKYHLNEKSVSIDGQGIEGIPQNDEYYDNIEDNLMFADLSWLHPLCKDIKAVMSFNLEVLPDGSMDHNNIQTEVNLSLPLGLEKSRTLGYLYPIFQRLLKYRAYGTFVEFKGHKNSLTAVKFFFNMDGRKINTLLKNSEEKVNHQFLSQWMTALDYVLDYNQGEFKYTSKLPIVSGRMVTNSFHSSVCFKFPDNKLTKRDKSHE